MLSGGIGESNTKSDISQYSDSINKLFDRMRRKNTNFDDALQGLNIPASYTDSLRKYVANTDAAKRTAKDFQNTLTATGKAGAAAASGVTTMAKQTSKLATAGRMALGIGGNILLNVGISMALQAASKAWDDYANRQENAIAKAEDNIENYNQKQQEFTNTSKLIAESGKRFVELQKGTENGINIRLTTDEFEEYNNLASQIAESFPELVSGYTSLGDPIISATSSVNELNAALEKQQEIFADSQLANADEIAEGFNAKVNQLKTGNEVEQGLAQRQNLLDAMVGIINEDRLSGINTDFSKYFTQSWGDRAINGFIGDITGAYNDFVNGSSFGKFVDGFLNAPAYLATWAGEAIDKALGTEDFNTREFLGLEESATKIAEEAFTNNELLADTIDLEEFLKLSPEERTNRMLDYDLGLEKILKDAGIDYDEINAIEDDEERNRMYQAANEEIVRLQQENKAKLDEAFNDVKPLIDSVFNNSDNMDFYQNLQDSTRNALSSVIESMDYQGAVEQGFLDETGNLDTDAIINWGTDLVQSIKRTGVEDSLSELFSLSSVKDDMNYNDYLTQSNELMDEISKKVPQLSKDVLSSATGFEDAVTNLRRQRADLMNDGIDEGFLDSLSNADMQLLWDLNADGLIQNANEAREALESAKKAAAESDPNKYYSAWQSALETENEGLKYDNMLSGFETVMEAYENGLTGTDDFKSFAALISPTGSDDPRNFAENYPKFQRYFTEGKEGINNFLNDMSTLVDTSGRAMAEFNKETGRWDFNVSDVNQLGQKLGISSEMVSSLFGKMREYGIDNNIISSAEEGGTRIGQLITDLENEKTNLALLESTTAENEQGYSTDAGAHTYGNQTSIDESRAKIQQYNQDIVDTIDNTKALINQQNESEEGRRKAAIAATEALNEQKKAAEEAGLAETANVIQGEMDKFGQEYGFDVAAEVNFDMDKATNDVQTLMNSAFSTNSTSVQNLQDISDRIQQITERGGDVAALVTQFNNLASSYGTLYRMDSDGNIFNFQNKVAETQQLAENIERCQTAGGKATVAMSEMATNIQSLSSAGVNVTSLVDSYNELAKQGGSQFRMEYTGEIVSVEDYTGEKPEIEATANITETSGTTTINADVSGTEDVQAFNSAVEATPEGKTTVINATVSGETQVNNLITGLEKIPANTPTTVNCEVSNAEELNTIQSKVDELNAGGKQITLNATVNPKLDKVEQLETDSDVTVDAKATITEVDTEGIETPTIDVKGKLTSVEQPPTSILNSNTSPTVEQPKKIDGGTVTYKAEVEPNTPPELSGTGTAIYRPEVNDVPPPITGGVAYYTAQLTNPELPAAYGKGYFTVGDSPEKVPDASGIANFDLGESPRTVPPAYGIANFTLGSYPSTVPAAQGVVNYTLGSVARPNASATINLATGTMLSPARASGTAYNVLNMRPISNAHAGGKVALPRNEEALVNEIGTESIIRDGKWFLIPGGMHRENLKKGDIILSASQTEDLLTRGKAIGHGRAYANGTTEHVRDYVTPRLLSSYASGTSNLKEIGHAYAEGTDDSITQVSDALQDILDHFTNFFDYVERAIDNITRNIDKYQILADGSNTMAGQNKQYDAMIASIQDLRQTYKDSIAKYEAVAADVANRVGLSQDLMNKVQNGTINVEELSADDKARVEAYAEWVDKAEELKNDLYQLRVDERDALYKKLDVITEHYEALVEKYDARAGKYSAKVSWMEATGQTRAYVTEANWGKDTPYINALQEQRSAIGAQYKLVEKELALYTQRIKEIQKSDDFNKANPEYQKALAKKAELEASLYENKEAYHELTQAIREARYSAIEVAIDGLKRVADRMQAAIDYFEEVGYGITEHKYTNQMKNNSQRIEENNRLIEEKRKELVTYEYNSEEYQRVRQEISELNNEIIELATNNERIKKQIRELRWQDFNFGMENIDNMISDIEHAQSLINEDNFLNDDGTFTSDDAQANLLLLGKGIELNNQKIAEYRTALEKLQQELNNGVITQEQYNEESAQFIGIIQDSATAIQGYKDEILDMYIEQCEKLNEILQENIDLRQEALEKMEDYYDYDRNLKDQTKDIDNLRAQIAALSGVILLARVLFNCGEIPITLSRYNVTGNGVRECGACL